MSIKIPTQAEIDFFEARQTRKRAIKDLRDAYERVTTQLNTERMSTERKAKLIEIQHNIIKTLQKCK